MDELRHDEWSDNFKKWIIDLVKLSLRSSIGQFGESFYRQKNGVPTGGSLCVQLANICVYYIMRKHVYSNEHLMEKITSLKRFIDDGAGFYSGTKRQYSEWINQVNSLLSKDGLNIDEHVIMDPQEFVSFLDIQFTFDNDGKLQTDLYVKPTDSRSYLQYGSAHSNHTFSGIVHSQCLRLRRIINNNERLSTRLEELKTCFLNSNYPKNMVNNITKKVSTLERQLPKSRNSSNSSIIVPTSPKKIRVISTYGNDTELVGIAKKFEPSLASTPSLSGTSSSSNAAESSPTTPKLFKYVKRTGSSLRSTLVKVKNLALNKNRGHTRPCRRKNCQCCRLISEKDVYRINGKVIKPCSGSCTTYNIIYCIRCKICNKYYVGRSVRQLNVRIGEHRRGYYKLLGDLNNILANNMFREDDEFSPGFHLIDDHNLTSKSDFCNNYEVFLLDTCSPKQLEVYEHKYIHLLKTLKPFGINTMNPFSIPLLNFT